MKKACPQSKVNKLRKQYRTVLDNCQELMLPLDVIRQLVRKEWIYYCGIDGCRFYHCGYTKEGETVTLDMLQEFSKLSQER